MPHPDFDFSQYRAAPGYSVHQPERVNKSIQAFPAAKVCRACVVT